MESLAATQGGQTLVLGCARDARHLLGASLEHLVARGLDVEVVSGLEARDDSLLITASRRPGAAYILFADAGLDGARIERVRGHLVGAGVPPTRIAVMPESWRGPIDIVEQAQRMGLRVGARRSTLVASVPELAPVGGDPGVSDADPANTGPRPRLITEGPLDPTVRRRPLRTVALVAGPVALLATTLAIAVARDPAPEVTPEEARAKLRTFVDQFRRPGAAAGEPSTTAPSAPSVVVAAVVPAVATASDVALPAPVSPPAVQVAPPSLAVIPQQPAALPAAAVPPPPPARESVDIEIIDSKPVAEIDEEEMQSIYAGLVARRFRALDILLIAPEPPRRKGKRILKGTSKMSWAAASTYCDNLQIGGVDGWRLPRVGELSSLTNGSMLQDGRFWSATEGDTFGSSRVVWNSDQGRMGGAPQRWKGGRVVCVRTLARPLPG